MTTTISTRRGSMRQRGSDAWELRVYRGLDPATGRQRYATRTVHGSRRTATRALVAEVDGARVDAGTVAELLERWFAAASPGWAATTRAHTRSSIDCHLLVHLGHLSVGKLTTADIDDLYGWLLRHGGRHGGGLAPGTVHRIHAVLHRALAQALRWDWVWINPATSASPPQVRRPELCPPDPAEVATLLASVRDDQPLLFCFLRLAATTGAGRGMGRSTSQARLCIALGAGGRTLSGCWRVPRLPRAPLAFAASGSYKSSSREWNGTVDVALTAT